MAKLGKRGERLKAKYAEARAAGFSSKDAMRLRTYSDEKFNEAVSKGKLEQPQEKYRSRAKLKYEEKDYINKSKSKTIFDFKPSKKNLEKLKNEMKKLYTDGWYYFYIRVILTYEDGTSDTLQSAMWAVKDIMNADQITVIIDTMTKNFVARYGYVDIYDIQIDIIFWKTPTNAKQ